MSRPTHSACSIELAIQNGNKSFNDSLIGVELKIAMTNSGLPWSVYDSQTNTFTDGYSIDIVNALATEAGFIPTFSLFELNNTETYSDGLVRVLQTHDFAGLWFTDAASRRILNMNFGYHFIDSTTVLIIPKPKYEHKTFSMTAFLTPFSAELWILLVFGILFNAICGFLFHIMEQPSSELEISKNLFYQFGSYVYVSFGHFTAAGDGFEPVSIWSRINTILWSFFVVIVLSSYTANLATALISEVSVANTLDTIDAIVVARKPICILETTIEADRAKEKWPHIIFVDSTRQTYASYMRDGTCVGALLGYTDASVILAENCDMQMTTTRIFTSGSSFAFQTDENRCGPTILKLLDYHFVILEEKGILEELWEKQIQAFECQFDAPEPPDDDSIQLGVRDLGGLASIYAIGAVVLLSVNAIWCCFKKKKDYTNATTETDIETEIENEMTTSINNKPESIQPAIQSVDE